MPTDANGVYSLPASYLATTGNTIITSQHNPIFEDLAGAVTARLMASGANAMTGPLRNTDGTVAAPSVTFASAVNSGFYKTPNGFGISIGGTKVAEFTAGGLASGARFLGELIPYSGSTSQPLTVFPVGQTLSRAAYAALWTYAQTEIAAGNTFYNNGDGSTTFGIGDLRGRGFAIKDNLGGSPASRLTTAGGGVDGATLGAPGGAQNASILQGHLPPINLVTTVTDPGHGHPGSTGNTQGTAAPSGSSGQALQGSNNTGSLSTQTLNIANNTTGITAITALGGSGTPFKLMQPTMVVGCLLFAGA